MYQPDFPTVPFRLGLYPVNACCRRAYARSNCALKINVMKRSKPTSLPPLSWGVAMMLACLSTTTGA